MQTRAEVIAGLLEAGVGAERSRVTLTQLERTPSLPIDDDLADVCARLTAELKRSGHALHAKHHTADRWIAATAIRWDLPLLTNDGIYRNTPGLRLLKGENTRD